MKNDFGVRVLGFSNLLEIDGARTSQDFSALLEAMDYGDQSGMGDDELREMCIMSLQDFEPVEAAYLVLKRDLGDVLREGQLQNIANEMLDEKLWEEYADTALHERLFNTGSLLYAAFPGVFPKPDAVRVELEVTAANTDSRELLAPPLDESFLVRLLADGMDEHAVLNRLYGDQITGPSFPNAEEIVWILRTKAMSDDILNVEVIGSGCWLDALESTDSYNSVAYADRAPGNPH